LLLLLLLLLLLEALDLGFDFLSGLLLVVPVSGLLGLDCAVLLMFSIILTYRAAFLALVVFDTSYEVFTRGNLKLKFGFGNTTRIPIVPLSKNPIGVFT